MVLLVEGWVIPLMARRIERATCTGRTEACYFDTGLTNQ